MNFDWSTFVFEIINFLILVWILKRFLYKPILAIITERKTAIEKDWNDAYAMQGEAEVMRQRYENRLQEWEKEKNQARMKMQDEVNAERSRLLASLETTLAAESERRQVIEQRRLTERQRALEVQAIAHSAQFTASLLANFADASLEKRIITKTLADLQKIPAEDIAKIRNHGIESPIVVTSTYSLSKLRQDAIRKALTDTFANSLDCVFKQDPDLKAGLRIQIGPWLLRANLQDELAFFTEAARADA